MKNIRFFLPLLFFALLACGKGGNTPVDQIVILLDQAVEKTQSINSVTQLNDVQNIISPEDVWTIIRENADYELSNSDKSKLKKSYDKLVKAAYEKSCEFIPNDEMKKLMKNQLDLWTEGIKKNIDNAKTLGQIRP
ncbi:MAG: hypothetical protein J1F67_00400 [Muribaculaceae bacterium]|nr:hypothetical protein [Muribaculaceae bacterium]